MLAKNHLFCFGPGYTARTLGLLLSFSEEEWQIGGTTRSSEKVDSCLIPYSAPVPSDVTHLLISIPPDENGDKVLADYPDLAASLPHLRWIGYLSTTGVYGDTGGEWVDETASVTPPNARLRNRVLAENQWLAFWHNQQIPVHIFRLAGIYGPGRSVIEQLRDGAARRIDKPGQYFSRIHVEDIAGILHASIMHPTPGEIYNLADDYPSSQEEVVRFAAELLGMEPPPLVPFAEAELSDMARSFYQSNRRVRNDKAKALLGGQGLRYPTYREGLSSCIFGG